MCVLNVLNAKCERVTLMTQYKFYSSNDNCWNRTSIRFFFESGPNVTSYYSILIIPNNIGRQADLLENFCRTLVNKKNPLLRTLWERLATNEEAKWGIILLFDRFERKGNSEIKKIRMIPVLCDTQFSGSERIFLNNLHDFIWATRKSLFLKAIGQTTCKRKKIAEQNYYKIERMNTERSTNKMMLFQKKLMSDANMLLHNSYAL